MITYVELVMFVVYAVMAGYIVYLQSQVNKFKYKTVFLQDVLDDVVNNRVEIYKTADGFKIINKGV
jgi:hypothetical protein